MQGLPTYVARLDYALRVKKQFKITYTNLMFLSTSLILAVDVCCDEDLMG